MFSVKEKMEIAERIEELLLNLNHPEMPDEKPSFKIHIDGKESWSWADIEPNWKFDDGTPAGMNQWNEHAREALTIKEMLGGKDLEMTSEELQTPITEIELAELTNAISGVQPFADNLRRLAFERGSVKLRMSEIEGALAGLTEVRKHMREVNVKKYDKYNTLLNERFELAESIINCTAYVGQ